MNKHRWLILLFVILAGTYIWQILAIPPDQASLARYQLSYQSAQLLRLSIAAPLIAIWAIALFGFIRLDRYAMLLRGTQEHPVWRNISTGLLVLAVSLPLTSIISNWTSSQYYNNAALTPRMIILNNYFSLAFIAVAMFFIYRGTRHLFNGPVVKRDAWPYGPLYLLVILVISSLFVFMTLSNPARQFPTGSARIAAYYLPDWLLMFTIIIPYIAVWYAGIKSVEFMHAYRRYVRGKIYKTSLRSLAVGLGMVILSWVAIRFINAMTTAFNSITLKYVLIILYALIFLIGFGYSMIARGSTKLAKIEEA